MTAHAMQSAMSSAVSGSMPSYGFFALLGVSVEAHERELGLDEAGSDLGHADRLAEELEPQRLA